METIIDLILRILSSFGLSLLLDLGAGFCMAVVEGLQLVGRAILQPTELGRIVAGVLGNALQLANLRRLLVACAVTQLVVALITTLMAIAPPTVKQAAKNLRRAVIKMTHRTAQLLRRGKASRPLEVHVSKQRFNKGALKEKFKRIRQQALSPREPGPEGSPA